MTDAVLFDLGNTLVSYYRSDEFEPILRECVASAASVWCGHGLSIDVDAAFEQAKSLNRERTDLRVWPLSERLAQLFPGLSTDPAGILMAEATQAFLGPIFMSGVIDPQAQTVLRRVREMGYRTAIVSNTPWGSPAGPWRRELGRMGLAELVDETVFCVDVGWRKPAPAPFHEALSRLGVAAPRAVFVGDDAQWDVKGAKDAGMEPILLATSHTEAEGVTVISQLGELIDVLENGS